MVLRNNPKRWWQWWVKFVRKTVEHALKFHAGLVHVCKSSFFFRGAQSRDAHETCEMSRHKYHENLVCSWNLEAGKMGGGFYIFYIPFISNLYPIYIQFISHLCPIYIPFMSHLYPKTMPFFFYPIFLAADGECLGQELFHVCFSKAMAAHGSGELWMWWSGFGCVVINLRSLLKIVMVI